MILFDKFRFVQKKVITKYLPYKKSLFFVIHFPFPRQIEQYSFFNLHRYETFIPQFIGYSVDCML